MNKNIERLGIALLSASMGAGAMSVKEKADKPLQETGGNWSSLPVNVDNAKISVNVQGQQVELKVNETGELVYRICNE